MNKAEEEFEAWVRGKVSPSEAVCLSLAKASWLASREATAKRCVEILRKREYEPMEHGLMTEVGQCADAIEREFL